MNLELNKKTAVISGSTKGIGFAVARQLAAEGAHVIVNGRTDKAVTSALEQIQEAVPSAKVEGFAGDLSTAEAAEELLKAFPTVDILVNNLGIYEPKSFEEIRDEDWLRFFEVNVLSGVRLSRSYLPQMLQKNWGRIVFISSESAINTPVEMIHYGVTKTAQLALARGLAESTAGTAVTVNSVLPGPTRSEGVEGFLRDMAKGQGTDEASVEKEFFRTVRPTSLLRRFATPEEVAALVVYVCSPRASATNGSALRVDGGTIRSIV